MTPDEKAVAQLLAALDRIPDTLLSSAIIGNNENISEEEQDLDEEEECFDCCVCGTCDCDTGQDC